jgi:hypothetical protein
MNLRIIKKNKLLSCIVILSAAYYFYPSKYDRLMKPIEEIKKKEKSEGISNPVYDGITEPDFPDRDLNDSTLEGVDSNGDGVRDDVEIWINRTAEAESIRKSKKDVFRAYFNTLNAIKESRPEKEVHELMVDILQERECHSYTMLPFKKYYFKKYGYDGSIRFSRVIEIFFDNTSLRREIFARFNSYPLEGTLGVRDDNYCQKKSFVKEININIENMNKEYALEKEKRN